MNRSGRTSVASGPDRGQLLLAGAFVIAATLLGLTLVVSAGNYTQTVSSNAVEMTAGQAVVDARDTVRANVAAIVESVNRDVSDGTPPSDYETKFENRLNWYATQLRTSYARSGTYVDVTTAPVGESTDVDATTDRIERVVVEFRYRSARADYVTRLTVESR